MNQLTTCQLDNLTTGKLYRLNVPTLQLEKLNAPTVQLGRLNVPTLQLAKLNAPPDKLCHVSTAPGQLDHVNAPTGQLDRLICLLIEIRGKIGKKKQTTVYTYVAINLTNKKFQVGSTVDFKERQKQHLQGKGDLEFQRSLRKNPDSFFWLVSVDDGLDTRNEEQFYLDFYCGSRWCYNHNPSASCPPNPKGRTWEWGNEAKENWRGKGNPMFGKTTSQKQKDSVPKGKNHHSAKPVILTHPDGIEEEFDYLQLAADKYDLNPGNIAMVARGERVHHKGFKARYK